MSAVFSCLMRSSMASMTMKQPALTRLRKARKGVGCSGTPWSGQASIDPGQQFTWEHSNLEVNKPKNRYANVIAYDHSRVLLSSIDGTRESCGDVASMHMRLISVKCDQYWPTRGTETYGLIQVTLLDTVELATYCVRTFALYKSTLASVSANDLTLARFCPAGCSGQLRWTSTRTRIILQKSPKVSGRAPCVAILKRNVGARLCKDC
ncbi:hypothetical protein CRUP_019559 [Coryphaenoides rupestris]|nr:hypothetical protein CRUP_019559 [Coryphaenoides rupestris]